MSKIKTAIVITIVVSVASVFCLLFGNFPTEKTLVIAGVKWLELPLPFAVSSWWGLMLSPLALMVIIYATSCDLIVGKEPRDPRFLGEAQFKYKARLDVYFITNFSNIIAFCLVFLLVVLSSCSIMTDEIGGPLSSLIFGVFVWITCYTIFGGALQLFSTLAWKSCEYDDVWVENSAFTRRYQMTLVNFVKLGLVKSFPFIFGLTCGYILRQAMSVVGKFAGLFKIGDDDFAG